MHHDPFQNLLQTNPGLGSYYGAAAVNPLAIAQGALAQGAILPQQLAALVASQTGAQPFLGVSPLTAGFQNPAFITNPTLTGGLQQPVLNPLLALAAAAVAQQLAMQQQQQQSPNWQMGQPGLPFGQAGYPQLPFGQGGSVFGQIGYPQQGGPIGYGQPVGQIGYPLAPQSWVGQAAGSPYGQVQPLFSQLTGRPIQGPGISPWGW